MHLPGYAVDAFIIPEGFERTVGKNDFPVTGQRIFGPKRFNELLISNEQFIQTLSL